VVCGMCVMLINMQLLAIIGFFPMVTPVLCGVPRTRIL